MEYVYKYVSFKPCHKKTLENILESKIYFSKTTDTKYRDDCVVLTEQEINSSGIFSTSDSYENLHLWNKFGYGSSGICIEYDLNKILATTNNLNQKKVEYPIENEQMSYDIFALQKNTKKRRKYVLYFQILQMTKTELFLYWKTQ